MDPHPRTDVLTAKGKCGHRDTCRECHGTRVARLQAEGGRHLQRLEEAGGSLRGSGPADALTLGRPLVAAALQANPRSLSPYSSLPRLSSEGTANGGPPHRCCAVPTSELLPDGEHLVTAPLPPRAGVESASCAVVSVHR